MFDRVGKIGESPQIKNLDYVFKDQNIIEEKIKNIIKSDNLSNLFTSDQKKQIDFDIVYFGSSLQYIKNYKEELLTFFNKSKYILISQTPFFNNDQLSEKIILKQINMHPEINYLYLFNLNYFIKFMNKNNYELVEKNINNANVFKLFFTEL